MKREKVHLEYLLNGASRNVLWSTISTPSGLETWFADKVNSDDRTVEFIWGKTESRTADIVSIRAYSFIRFHWTDDDDSHSYFEIKMNQNELTNDIVLEITDTCDADEADDIRELWDSQVVILRRTCGF